EEGRIADGLADARQGLQLVSPGDAREVRFRGVVALLYARQGRHAEAMGVLDELLRQQGDQALVHVWRGWVFHIAGRRDDARAAADAALACDPHYVEVRALEEALKTPGGSSAQGAAPGGTTS